MKRNKLDNEIRIVHQNIQSIRNKLTEVEIMLHELKVDILCLTEHWMDGNESVSIPGYNMVAKYSRRAKACGGVCILARNPISTSLPKILNHIPCIDSNFEYTAVEITLNKQKYIIIVIYRTPDSKPSIFFHHLETLLIEIRKKYKFIIICGDFNIDTNVHSSIANSFLEIFSSFNIRQTIHDPTHFTKTSCSLIDNIFTNIPCDSYTSMNIYTGFNNHLGQAFFLQLSSNINPCPLKTMRKRNFSEANILHFLTLLSNEFESVNVQSEETNVNQMFNDFMVKFKLIFECAFIVMM